MFSDRNPLKKQQALLRSELLSNLEIRHSNVRLNTERPATQQSITWLYSPLTGQHMTGSQCTPLSSSLKYLYLKKQYPTDLNTGKQTSINCFVLLSAPLWVKHIALSILLNKLPVRLVPKWETFQHVLRKGRKSQEKWKRKKAREEAYSNCKWSLFPHSCFRKQEDKALMLIFQIMLP